MAELTVDLENFKELLDPELIKDINHLVTENEIRRPTTKEEEDMEEGTERTKAYMPEIDFCKEDDYYEVLNDGNLYGLQQQLQYEFEEDPDVIDLASYIIEHFAQSQIFGNGNKRTAYVMGYFVLLFYQLAEGYEEIVLPELTDEFVELISNVAIRDRDENREEIREFLTDIEESIKENQDQLS